MERWKDVSNYEGAYQVSDRGRVRGLPRMLRHGHFWPGKVLAEQADKDGYVTYRLSLLGQSFHHKGHQLVGQAFCPGWFPGAEINHKNGVKNDNRAENLEWVTKSQNHLHRVRVLGKTTKNSKPRRKPVRGVRLTTGEVRTFESMTAAARELSVSIADISMCCGKTRVKSAGGWAWSCL